MLANNIYENDFVKQPILRFYRLPFTANQPANYERNKHQANGDGSRFIHFNHIKSASRQP